MPRLRTYEIKDAKLGSKWLTAVYKGDTKVWKFPGMTQPTTLEQYYSSDNMASIALKWWLHRPDNDATKLIDLEVNWMGGAGFEKAPYSIQRSGFTTEYNGVMYYQWWSSIVIAPPGPNVPIELGKDWRVRYNGGAWSGALQSGLQNPLYPFFVIPGTPNQSAFFKNESEIDDG